MSLEDLMDRGMEIADFLVPQEKTEEFFYAILDELEMPESFFGYRYVELPCDSKTG